LQASKAINPVIKGGIKPSGLTLKTVVEKAPKSIAAKKRPEDSKSPTKYTTKLAEKYTKNINAPGVGKSVNHGKS
jgi:hypothetical protein